MFSERENYLRIVDPGHFNVVGAVTRINFEDHGLLTVDLRLRKILMSLKEQSKGTMPYIDQSIMNQLGIKLQRNVQDLFFTPLSIEETRNLVKDKSSPRPFFYPEDDESWNDLSQTPVGDHAQCTRAWYGEIIEHVWKDSILRTYWDRWVSPFG